MTRSIDNFLTKEEQNMINNFIVDSKKRLRTINGRTGETPPPLDAEPLKQLHEKKYHEWNSHLKSVLIPNQGISYRQFIKNNEIFCAVEKFLTTLNDMIGVEILTYDHKNILQDTRVNFENATEITTCPYPPCRKH